MSEKPFPFSGYEEIARKAWQMFRKTHGLNSYASILALNAWERVGKITRNDAILEESKQLAREYLSGRVPSVAGAYNSYIYQQGGNATAWLLERGYLPEAEKILVPAAERLCREFPRNSEGVFIHPTHKPELLWIDTVFGVCPFLVWVGKATGRKEFIEESVQSYLDNLGEFPVLVAGIEAQRGELAEVGVIDTETLKTMYDRVVELNNLVEKRFGGSEAEMLEVLYRDGCPDPVRREALVQAMADLR